jgi:hypothetical protein
LETTLKRQSLPKQPVKKIRRERRHKSILSTNLKDKTPQANHEKNHFGTVSANSYLSPDFANVTLAKTGSHKKHADNLVNTFHSIHLPDKHAYIHKTLMKYCLGKEEKQHDGRNKTN